MTTIFNIHFKFFLPVIGNIKVVILTLLLFPLICYSQQVPEYEEIPLVISVQRLGHAEVPAIIKDETVFLPVKDLFNFLKINNYQPSSDSIAGFFIDEKAKYLIDGKNNRINYRDKKFDLSENAMFHTQANLYLSSLYFEKIFGLECSFDFRSLSVNITTTIELPAIREIRREELRRNNSQIIDKVKADTIMSRSNPLFHFGMADWTVTSSQQKRVRDIRFNLSLGAILAGGNANLVLNYDSRQGFKTNQQYYQWRFVNNSMKIFRQVTLGKIFQQTTSLQSGPIAGIQFTNKPTSQKQSFGTYRISEITEPGWIVELYVNDVLVNYVKTDESGLFTFDVPLVYGSSDLKLRYFGPWGEERAREQKINIPFNFIPVKQLEYTLSAGIVEDDRRSQLARMEFNYGVSSHITVGTGWEYFSSAPKSHIPFANLSVRLSSDLLLSAEYSHGVKTNFILGYRRPSNLEFKFDFTHYAKGQKTILHNHIEERKAVISFPFSSRRITAFTRLTFNQVIAPQLKYTTMELLLSGVIAGFNAGFTTNATLAGAGNANIHSSISFRFPMPAKFSLAPQIEYSFNNKKITALKWEIQKSFLRGCFANFTYGKDVNARLCGISIGFRYNLSFAQTAFTMTETNREINFEQSARGSFLYDRKGGYLGARNTGSVGKSGLLMIPYLDLNCNNRRDADEPKVAGLKVRISSSPVKYNNKDTTIAVYDLEPYDNYLIELGADDFENIAWQIRKKKISIVVEPNQLRLLEIPVSVMSEVAGTVYLQHDGGKKGLGGINVFFYNSDSSIAGKIVTETDGFFSFTNLLPGSYTAKIDEVQLGKLKLNSLQVANCFTIARSKDGDTVSGLDFMLRLSPPRE